MNTDAEVYALVRRDARVALDHGALDFDRAAHRIDHATELDDQAVAGALDEAAVVDGDGGVNQIAAQQPKPRKRSLLVDAGEPAVANDIGDQDRGEFPRLAHRAPLRVATLAQMPAPVCGAKKLPLRATLPLFRPQLSTP